LLEIMVSLAILSISLVTLLSAHNRALSLNAEAAMLTDAVTLAREEMERLYFKPPTESLDVEKKRRKDYPLLEWLTQMKETPFENIVEARVVVYKIKGGESPPVVSLKAYLAR
ncbi:hypothetical protein MNBD_NITROSPINAE04-950, partial [hydrothermal vent metagenome]